MFFTRKTVSILLAGSALSLVGTQAAAQETSAPPAQNASTRENALDEIVVTAQKRTERLMDVPLSITSASGDQLANRGITETSQLSKLVPGFTYQESNYGTPILTIRGIGYFDGAFGAGPSVMTYLDQVPMPYVLMTRGATLDLERVEVLKGPQGTLFGQNSTGGAINYIAAKPTPELSAGARVSYGRFNAVDAEGFLSGPLSSTLRARLAVRGEFADGWQKSITRPDDRWGKKEFYNGRLLLDWTPSETLSFTLNLSGWQENSEIAATQLQQIAFAVPTPNPLNQFVYDALNAAPIRLDNARSADWTPGIGHKDNTFYMIALRGDWNISDEVTLTSITAYSRLKVSQPFDPDGMAFENFSTYSHPGLLTSFTQELRVAGTTDRLKWMVGGNFQRDIANESSAIRNEATNGVLPRQGTGGAGVVFVDTTAYLFNQQPTIWGVFGSVDYELTDQLTAQVSARYTEQTRQFEGCIRDNGPGTFGEPAALGFLGLSELFSGSPSVMGPDRCLTLNDTTTNPALLFKPVHVFNKLKENNVSWRASLNWKPDNDSLLYVYAAKGYKAGTFSTPPGVTASEFDPIGQESVMAYEAGAKHSFGRQVDISGAIYYYDYKDKQLVGVANIFPFGNLPKLVNIPKSRVWGAEFEVTARPIDRLRLQGGVSYVNSRVQEDPAIPIDAVTGATTTFVGEAFPNTPKWQMIGDAEYGIPISGTAQAFIGGSVVHRSKSNAQFSDRPEFTLPSYTTIDLRAGVEWEKWRAQIWGRNITNKYYWVNVLRLSDTINRIAAMPVTYGITLSYRF
ncbi:MAG TPA: TonB-dependent receptor [Allosphingosinicella sp.]|nr:TonB-dependent receptor [Allosphingosinicella sp.]